jgi:adenylosuccinate synthase
VEAIIDEYVEFDKLIDPYVTDTAHYIGRALREGKRVLAEGAQGSLLDIDHGTYPFVTSSHPTAGGCSTGLGIAPTSIDRVIGIVKAYCTRVGNGPFVTELKEEIGDHLGTVGAEFGATTGRPRRCGWLDLVALNYSTMINGFTELSLTKLDVLSGLDELKVCTHYSYNGKILDRFPSEAHILEQVEPVYASFPGWQEDIAGVSNMDELPRAAQNYIDYIEQETGVRISMVATGPKRSQTILR